MSGPVTARYCDDGAFALYVSVSADDVSHTVEQIESTVMHDVDRYDCIVGYEFLLDKPIEIAITNAMVKRLLEAMHERPNAATSDWLDHAINGEHR